MIDLELCSKYFPGLEWVPGRRWGTQKGHSAKEIWGICKDSQFHIQVFDFDDGASYRVSFCVSFCIKGEKDSFRFIDSEELTDLKEALEQVRSRLVEFTTTLQSLCTPN